MKKVYVLVVPIILIGFFLLMCFLPIMEQRVEGIENYSPAASSLGLTANLFPGEDFLERFDYSAGDYHFYFDGRLSHGFSTAISILQYTPEQYAQAKEYCLNQFVLTDEHQYQVGNYAFIEHLCYTDKNERGKYVPVCQFPTRFNMFAYNDAECTLLFLGYFNGKATEQPLVNFEAFYSEYFSQYHMLGE